MDYLHAEDGEYQVQHSQEHHGDHLHAEKLDKVQHNTEQKGDNLHVEEDENQVKPNPEHVNIMIFTCMQVKVKIESNSPSPRTAFGSPA